MDSNDYDWWICIDSKCQYHLLKHHFDYNGNGILQMFIMVYN